VERWVLLAFEKDLTYCRQPEVDIETDGKMERQQLLGYFWNIWPQ